MTGASEQITDDLLDAFVIEAQAHEKEVLAWADGLVMAGSHTVGEALAAGFRAKVPLAGGSIGAAVETALASMDITAEDALKSGYDNVIAWAKGSRLSSK